MHLWVFVKGANETRGRRDVTPGKGGIDIAADEHVTNPQRGQSHLNFAPLSIEE